MYCDVTIGLPLDEAEDSPQQKRYLKRIFTQYLHIYTWLCINSNDRYPWAPSKYSCLADFDSFPDLNQVVINVTMVTKVH